MARTRPDGRKPVARIVVTRPAGRERALVERLRGAGHEVTTCRSSRSSRSATIRSTSAATTGSSSRASPESRELRRRMRGTPTRVAAIGNATAEAFGGADLVAETSTQEGLLEALPPSPGRVLFAGAERARRLLPDTLGADVVVLYRTVELTPAGLARMRPGDRRLAVGRPRARAGRRGHAGRLDRPGDDPRRARGGSDGRRGGANQRPRRPGRRRSSGRSPRRRLALGWSSAS